MKYQEKYLELVKEANKHFDIADHMLFMTYPLINDTKIIITIVENLYKAVLNGIDSLIHYDYLYKRISYCPDDIDGKMEMFKQVSRRYNFDRDTLILLKDLNELIEHRKKSPMEFSRRESYILADKDYRLKTISLDKAKQYNQRAKIFIQQLNTIFRK